MARQASVQSIDALRRFRAAIREYVEVMQDVLDNLQAESQRTVDWVRHDRMTYWPAQVRQASDGLTGALDRLQMKQLTISGRDPVSATEEKQQVQQARDRLRYTERKAARTRQLSGLLQHEVDEYRGVLAKLEQLIEADLPQAMASLDRMLASLEKYTALRPSGELTKGSGTGRDMRPASSSPRTVDPTDLGSAPDPQPRNE